MMHQEAMMKQCRSDLNKIFHISKTPGEHAGAQISFKEELRVQIKKKVYMVSIKLIILQRQFLKQDPQEKITDIFGYLKNTHKNPKFGRVRQIPIWELGWEFPDWDLSHSPKFGIFVGIL